MVRGRDRVARKFSIGEGSKWRSCGVRLIFLSLYYEVFGGTSISYVIIWPPGSCGDCKNPLSVWAALPAARTAYALVYRASSLNGSSCLCLFLVRGTFQGLRFTLFYSRLDVAPICPCPLDANKLSSWLNATLPHAMLYPPYP